MKTSDNCGPHCGVKDGHEAHCNCIMCHGRSKLETQREFASWKIS